MTKRLKTPDNVEDVLDVLFKYFKTENIKPAYRFVPDDSNNQYEGVYLAFEFNKNRKRAIILIEETQGFLSEEAQALMGRRMFEYLGLCGYENSPENFFLMMLLHEIGHIDWMDKLIAYDLIDYAEFVRANVETSFRFAFMPNDIEDMREDGIDPHYFFRVDETYADAFAIKYFVKARQLLADEGITFNLEEVIEA